MTCVCLIRKDYGQNVSHMRMCIRFLSQILKHKNAHVFLLQCWDGNLYHPLSAKKKAEDDG